MAMVGNQGGKERYGIYVDDQHREGHPHAVANLYRTWFLPFTRTIRVLSPFCLKQVALSLGFVLVLRTGNFPPNFLEPLLFLNLDCFFTETAGLKPFSNYISTTLSDS